MNGLTISQVAHRAHVNVMTVRYYERRGLLPEPPRSASGYRQYLPEAVKQIRFIKSAQELGFSLKEISELLALRVKDENNCEEVKVKAEKKIEDIEEKMKILAQMKKVLSKLTAACATRTPSSRECPILEALDSNVTGEKT